MTGEGGADRYNYVRFNMTIHEELDTFSDSPQVGSQGPEFPLWQLNDEGETSVHQVCRLNRYTMIEFGSIT